MIRAKIVSLTHIDGCELEGQKRQNYPYCVEWACPKCKKTQEIDLTTDYISYGALSGDVRIHLYCEYCDTESYADAEANLVLVLKLKES